MSIKVKLLRHTPEPEQAIAIAARLCYSKIGFDALEEKLTPDATKAFIEKIRGLGHMSVFEHASFTFGIEGISRVTSHQLVRHRVASYSQQSQRYVEHKEMFEWVCPPAVRNNPAVYQKMEDAFIRLHLLYREMVESGVEPEDARYLLPNATETKILVTMNARELIESFFDLRCCYRAQWEIRMLAEEMLRLVKPVAPSIFAGTGPGCVSGACPEGGMSCGKSRRAEPLFV